MICLTSNGLTPKLEDDWRGSLSQVVCSLFFAGHSHQWGRHGFDGDACGQEACRGAHTRNRVQNDNCQSTNGIRSLTSLGSRFPPLRPWAVSKRHTEGCSSPLRLGGEVKITG